MFIRDLGTYNKPWLLFHDKQHLKAIVKDFSVQNQIDFQVEITNKDLYYGLFIFRM